MLSEKGKENKPNKKMAMRNLFPTSLLYAPAARQRAGLLAATYAPAVRQRAGLLAITYAPATRWRALRKTSNHARSKGS